jgi:hypothetical protein
MRLFSGFRAKAIQEMRELESEKRLIADGSVALSNTTSIVFRMRVESGWLACRSIEPRIAADPDSASLLSAATLPYSSSVRKLLPMKWD